MNNIIQKSLEINTTTIIPDFGAIMKMGKTYMYNEFLKYDDGKLAAIVSGEYQVDLQKAKEDIANWVAEIKVLLEKGETVVFDNIGSISIVDGKLKFVVGSNPSNTIAQPKAVENEIPAKKEVIQPTKVEEQPKKEETSPNSNNSSDFRATEAIEKIQSFADKNELIAFTRSENRITVINALNKKLEELNGKKKEANQIEEVKAPENVIEEIKVEEISIIERPSVEIIKDEPNIIDDLIAMEEEEIKNEVDVIPNIEKSEPIIESVNEKTNIHFTEEKPVKEKVKELKPESDSEEENNKAIAAIVSGVEANEKENKKSKKKWILLVGILLILLGGGAVGYLKKDDIMALFEKKHEPKELADNHNSEKTEESEPKESITENEEKDNGESQENIQDGQTEVELEEVEEIVVENVPDDKPKIEDKPKANIQPSSSNGAWHIIAGSFSKEENANNMVSNLMSQGYKDAKILGQYNGLFTVRVASFNTKDEAKTALENFISSGNKGLIKKL
ncbi:MAG: SPOR domain-containing protein [Flavobacteriales bacterium]|nr:SPOR domain-containing protein [Flavobacteriales bacterium]